MPSDKLQPLRGECDELTAIFVTIVKQTRDLSAISFFLILNSYFFLSLCGSPSPAVR